MGVVRLIQEEEKKRGTRDKLFIGNSFLVPVSGLYFTSVRIIWDYFCSTKNFLYLFTDNFLELIQTHSGNTNV